MTTFLKLPDMDDETLLAIIDACIDKWKKIMNGTGKEKGSINCPLCWVFVNTRTRAQKRLDGEDVLPGMGSKCGYCPISQKTGGREMCRGTPYYGWSQATVGVPNVYNVCIDDMPADIRKHARAAAAEEVDFLIEVRQWVKAQLAEARTRRIDESIKQTAEAIGRRINNESNS